MGRGKFLLLSFLLIITGAIVVAGYYFLKIEDFNTEGVHRVIGRNEPRSVIEDSVSLKIFYPAGLSLQMSEIEIKGVFNPLKKVEASLKALFEQEHTIDTGVIPEKSSIEGLYMGIDGVFYIDLSRSFLNNFSGDIMDEYMLLKSIFETVRANNEEVKEVKLLIEGEEIETLGGHFFLKYPLKSLFGEEAEF